MFMIMKPTSGLHLQVCVFCNFFNIYLAALALSGQTWDLCGSAQASLWLWCTGLVALQQVESSPPIRDQTHVLCIGRQILNRGPPG